MGIAMNHACRSDLELDFAVLLQLSEAVGADDLVGVLDLILGSVPLMYRDLRQAAIGGNRQGVGYLAHQLRSECAHVGAARLVSRLEQLEENSQSGTLIQLTAEVENIASQIERFLDLLSDVRRAHVH